MYSKPVSLGIVTMVYVLTMVATCYISTFFIRENNILTGTFSADIFATFLIFIFSFLFRNASMYDPYWSVAPVPVVWFWLSHFQGKLWPPGAVILLAAVLLWAIRLTTNWARGWQGLQHQDWRYTELKTKTGKFYPLVNLLGIHLFPTIMVFFSLIPVYFMAQQKLEKPGSIFITGIFISILGTCFEYFADEQSRAFRKHSDSGEFIQTGLWQYSRHPNYFGEICFWWGLYIALLGIDLSKWWLFICPLSMTAMFVFISIPMMEKRNLEKRPGYEDYIKKVSMLFPLP